MERAKQLFKFMSVIGRSWVELTRDEQKALVVIIALFLLGLTVRFWHTQKEKAEKLQCLQEAAQFVTSDKKLQ